MSYAPTSLAAQDCEAIPSLPLRTAYTNKGLSLGLGTLAGVLMFGPWGGLIGTFVGWKIGNAIVIAAERRATAPCGPQA